jgi:uncharacterized protein
MMATRYFYLDASALAKRYTPEPGSAAIHHLFAQLTSDRFVALNIGIAEVVSIIVRKRNARIISLPSYAQALIDLRAEIIDEDRIRKIIPTTALVTAALAMIERHSINATDAILLRSAIDLAASLHVGADELVLLTSDRRLLRAAQTEGLLIFNPEMQTTADLNLLLE